MEVISCPQCGETVWKTSIILSVHEDIVLDTIVRVQHNYHGDSFITDGGIWKCANGHVATTEYIEKLVEFQGQI